MNVNSCNNMPLSQLPFLPPLYFAKKGASLSAKSSQNNDSTIHAPPAVLELPTELLHQCLTSYADWGDLAKLACVQSNWSRALYDAADTSDHSKWELAQALFQGTHGLRANPTQAMRLFLELANVPVDKVTNMPLPQESMEACFAPAMKQISQCFFTGAGVAAIDTGVGLAWLESAHTAAGDVEAAHEVALVYEYGHYGVEHDVVKAAEWFHKAADAGNMEAMAELGLCYELGCGVEQSDEEALEWYTKAAEKGHLVAKFSVGEAFEEARGVPQSDEEACLWYYKAAIEGDEDSRKALRRLEDIARIVVPGAAALLDA
jgi:TPR repeat protein